MIAETSAVLSSLKVAFDIAKGIQALDLEVEVNSAVINLQRQILQAQVEAFSEREAMMAMANRIRELEHEAAKASEWENQKARYKLSVSPIGAYTYDLKPEFTDEEAFHRICATCFNSGKKSLLHTTAKNQVGETVKCGNCKEELTLEAFENTIMTFSSRRSRYDEF